MSVQLVECETGEEKGRVRFRPATNFFLQKLHLTSNQDMAKKQERKKIVVLTGHRGMVYRT